MEKERELAIEILDLFENLLYENKVYIPSTDRTGEKTEACLFGDVYWDLEESITQLVKIGRVTTVEKIRRVFLKIWAKYKRMGERVGL